MDEPTIQQNFDLALQRHQAGHLQEAEEIYWQILAQQPEHAGALLHLALIAHGAGQGDVAVDLKRGPWSKWPTMRKPAFFSASP